MPLEFDRIARHFAPLAGEGAFGLRDDAALLVPPAGRALVISADAMVAGVHFLPDDPPDLVARKLLRVNLSDLAAKGATPLGYLLTVSVPRATEDAWFASFAEGLARDQAAFGLALLGGDTTGTPGPVALSLTILGHVAPGGMVMRAGARAGDGVFVTGTIGDGALGLAAAQGRLADPDGELAAAQGRLADPDGELADRYRLPRPRLGLVAPALVAAAMDVSDGLVQDLRHLCRAGGVGAAISAERVPLSRAASLAGPAWLATCLTGGDDYELLMAVRPGHEAALRARAAGLGIALTRIGTFETARGVRVLADGVPLDLGAGGWSHF